MTRSHEQPATGSIVSPTLIGREREVAALVGLVRQIAAGQGWIALVHGEAGIGKSRLLQESAARTANARYLRVACYELDRRRPYAPLNVLAALLGQPDPHLSPVPVPPAAVPEQGDFENDPQQVAARWTATLRALATAEPVVLIIEDVHWCDAASLDVVGYLAEHVSDMPLLLILTWRDDELHPALVRNLANIERTRLATHLPLEPLDRSGHNALVRALLAGYPAPPTVLDRLYALAGGNPFFTEELVRALLSRRGDPAAAPWERETAERLRLPYTVQATVMERTRFLEPATVDALTRASVIGQRFNYDLLRALTGQSDDRLTRTLQELVNAHLIRELSPDEFIFRHALTREAIYESLLARERRELHRQVVGELERRRDETPDNRLSVELAYHAYAAELWPEAMRYAVDAGRAAQNLFAPAAALAHYTDAILAARRLAQPLPASVYRARGKMLEMLGEFEAARADFEQAAAAAADAGDVVEEAETLLDLGFLWTARDYERAGTYFASGERLARLAGAKPLLAVTLNRIGLWYTHADQPLEGIRRYDEALTIFRDLGDTRALAETLDLRGVTHFMRGDLAAGWESFAEAIDLCRLSGNQPQLAILLLTVAIRGGAMHLDTVPCLTVPAGACQAEVQEAIQIAQDLHLPATEAYARIMLSHIEGWRGACADAEREAEMALRLAESIDHRMWQANALTCLGALRVEFGLGGARDLLERAMTLATDLHSRYMTALVGSYLVRAALGEGDSRRAATLLASLPAPERPPQTLAERLVAAARAEMLLAEGQSSAALDLLDHLEPPEDAAAAPVVPRLAHLRGQCRLALGQAAAATTDLAAAYRAAETTGNRTRAWLIAADYAEALRRQDRVPEALEWNRTAQRVAEELAGEFPGGPLRGRFLEQVARRLRPARPPSNRQKMRHDYDGLTLREREIAALVAQGGTNATIAATLFLSERTVEKHIENIMNKLGYHSRAQIAVWAAGKGLAG